MVHNKLYRENYKIYQFARNIEIGMYLDLTSSMVELGLQTGWAWDIPACRISDPIEQQFISKLISDGTRHKIGFMICWLC